MALISPGIEVSVVDESQYASTAVGTVPMLVVATAQDKQDPTTGGTAGGTLATNAGKTYLIGSQRELVSTFGEPLFYQNSSGTALHGYELNEYGLQSAYSLLGVSNRAYIVRADVDLAELEGSAGRPSGAPANGTHWLNSSTTSWGIFEWNASTQKFVNKIPTVITDSSQIDSGTDYPKTSVGKIGDYAINATNTNNLLYVKSKVSGWELVGSTEWYQAIPAVTGTVVNPVASVSTNLNVTTNSGTFAISITSADDISAIISAINTDTATHGVHASTADSKLNLHVADSDTTYITVGADDPALLTDIGITIGTYNSPAVDINTHIYIPNWKTNERPTGSVYVKLTNPNNGINIDLSYYSTAFENFISLDVGAYEGEGAAIYDLDPAGGGLNIEEGTVYMLTAQTDNGYITYKPYVRVVKGPTVVTGINTDFVSSPITSGQQITVQSSLKGTFNMSSTYTITMTGTTAESFVNDILNTEIPYVTARVTDTGAIEVTHELGGFIIFGDVSTGTVLSDAGFNSDNSFIKVVAIDTTKLIFSNSSALGYEVGEVEPSSRPLNARKWYHNVTDEIDIMIKNDTTWQGYQNGTDVRGFDLAATNPAGPFVSASEPAEQSDGTALEYGDLWVDTSDLENFPVIKRYESVDGEDTWVTIDNTDQTSQAGIVFADARWGTSGSVNPSSDDVPSITSLLTSDYIDLDCPDAVLYPAGTLLFNTRRSSYNVKEYRRNYFSSANFPGEVLPAEADAWVSVAGNMADGRPYMGRKAVRQVVVEAMKSAIDVSAELREEQRNFNVLAAPGYPELLQNMIALNNDRRNTGFIVGDTPFRLAANSTDIQNWANNAALATDNGDEGLVSADPYMGIFYPHGISTDLSGNTIMVPASHMILRTLIRSDDASYPWFAPAGTRRGVVDNATGLGYLDVATGEFVSTGVRESLRDTLYENSINPVAFFPGNGILNYGNKTRTATASALDRINVSRLTAYIRERLAVITKPFVFEPNDKLTRDEVKQVVEQLMNDLVAKRGLYDYLVVCDETNNTPDRIDRNELYIDIAIEPVKAVEYIYIPVRIQNTGSI